MPALRQISATGTPSCPCLRMNAFCASENLDAFIVFPSSQPKDLGRKTPVKNDPVSGDQITRGPAHHESAVGGRRFRRTQATALAHVRAVVHVRTIRIT